MLILLLLRLLQTSWGTLCLHPSIHPSISHPSIHPSIQASTEKSYWVHRVSGWRRPLGRGDIWAAGTTEGVSMEIWGWGGEAFQEEKTIHAKALRQTCLWASKKAENLFWVPGDVVGAAVTGWTISEVEWLTGLSKGRTFLENRTEEARGKQRDNVQDHCMGPRGD